MTAKDSGFLGNASKLIQELETSIPQPPEIDGTVKKAYNRLGKAGLSSCNDSLNSGYSMRPLTQLETAQAVAAGVIAAKEALKERGG